MQPYIPKPKLLLVDDDRANHIMIKEILEATGIIFLDAFSCQEAALLFQRHSKDIGLVVIDIILPDGDGVSLVKQLHRINPFVPAIAISAIEPALLSQKCKGSGFNAYLSKPFDLDVFKGIIFSYMSSSVSILKEY